MARKKNKKSFSNNLESLFEQRLVEDNAQDKPAMFDAKETSQKEQEKKVARKDKKPHRKSFYSNLEHFFKESLDSIMDGEISDTKRKSIEKSGKRAVGLDLLIKRTTTENVIVKKASAKPMTKRVTVVLDTSKIETLKRIAKEQKRPLTKLMEELVEEFLGKEN